MATYLELLALSSNVDLLKRAQIAVFVAADQVRLDSANSPAPTNQAERLRWAAKALNAPQGEAQRALFCILAQNRALTVAQISGASDAALQTAVQDAIDLLAVR